MVVFWLNGPQLDSNSNFLLQAVIPLCEGVNVASALEVIKTCDEEATATTNDLNICHVK